MNTVGEGLDPPGGKGCDIPGISAKTNRVHGRVKTLPYRNNETCAKRSNTNLPDGGGSPISTAERLCL